MGRLVIAILATALTLPAFPQADAGGAVDLRPKNMQYPDNLGFEDLPIGPVPQEFYNQGPTDATGISGQIFGE